jgi:Fis family transcriptional regulator
MYLPSAQSRLSLHAPVKAQLEQIIFKIRAYRMPYAEGLREFRKTFISVVLRELGENQYKAALKLRINRSTLRRNIQGLDIDPRKLCATNRRRLQQT